MLGMSCEKENLSTADPCVEAIIARDTAYKVVYNGCYDKSLWIEVRNNENVGEDTEIHTPSPILHPTPVTKYSNMLEIPLPDFWKDSNRRDTLLGARIYLNYRTATEAETNSIRNSACVETYRTHTAPLVVITKLSFENCMDLENK